LKLAVNTALLEQAIVNLVDNAIKYSDEDKKVTLSVLQSGGETVFEVADQGIGIPTEHLDRVFERFYRVDKARSRKLGGTGLGLSIVKNVAMAHGGRVEVDSEVGKGSVFRIHIPNGVHNLRNAQ
jgi:two-component system phosphate regulon sensor histidine kinase PhoR